MNAKFVVLGCKNDKLSTKKACKYQQIREKTTKKIIHKRKAKQNEKQLFTNRSKIKNFLLAKKNAQRVKKNFAMSNKFRKFAIHFQRIKFLKKDITKCQEFAK